VTIFSLSVPVGLWKRDRAMKVKTENMEQGESLAVLARQRDEHKLLAELMMGFICHWCLLLPQNPVGVLVTIS